MNAISLRTPSTNCIRSTIHTARVNLLEAGSFGGDIAVQRFNLPVCAVCLGAMYNMKSRFVLFPFLELTCLMDTVPHRKQTL